MFVGVIFFFLACNLVQYHTQLFRFWVFFFVCVLSIRYYQVLGFGFQVSADKIFKWEGYCVFTMLYFVLQGGDVFFILRGVYFLLYGSGSILYFKVLYFVFSGDVAFCILYCMQVLYFLLYIQQFCIRFFVLSSYFVDHKRINLEQVFFFSLTRILFIYYLILRLVDEVPYCFSHFGFGYRLFKFLVIWVSYFFILVTSVLAIQVLGIQVSLGTPRWVIPASSCAIEIFMWPHFYLFYLILYIIRYWIFKVVCFLLRRGIIFFILGMLFFLF